MPKSRQDLIQRVIKLSKEMNEQRPPEILSSVDTKVFFLRETAYHPQPEFFLITDEGILAKIAVTGELTSVEKLEGKKLRNVVEMNARGFYHLYRNMLPADGVINDRKKSPEQLLELIVNYVYEKASKINDKDRVGMGENFKVVTYNSLVSRFKLLKTLVSPTAIIPDQSPRTVIVKAGDGCPYRCAYCPEPLEGKFRAYSKDEFRQHLDKTKTALVESLGEHIMEMKEGFINISDILLLDLYKKKGDTDFSSLEAARLMRKTFPWLEKIGSFVGTLSSLEMSKKSYRGFNTYTSDFFHKLYDGADGIVRLYLGIETAHDEGSFLLNKRITYEQKIVAARVIQEAGIRLKVIVQIGVLGKGFYPLDKPLQKGYFVPWYDAVDKTSDWINEVTPYRIMESVWQNYGDLPINALIEQGRILPYDNPVQIERERRRIRSNISQYINSTNDKTVESGYEAFIPKRELPRERRMVIPN